MSDTYSFNRKRKEARASRRFNNLRYKIRSNHRYYSTYKFLFSYLLSQVGRPWDDVWSDLCARYDSRSHLGYCVRKDTYDDVDTHAFFSNQGKIVTHDYCNRETPVRGFYVHPKTGLLCDAFSKSRGSKHARYRWSGEKKEVTSLSIVNGAICLYYKYPDYTYELLECGKSPHNKFKSWFKISTIITPTEFWHTYGDQTHTPEWYTLHGYTFDKDMGTWGKMYRGTDRITYKQSCNRVQMKAIREFLREYNEKS